MKQRTKKSRREKERRQKIEKNKKSRKKRKKRVVVHSKTNVLFPNQRKKESSERLRRTGIPTRTSGSIPDTKEFYYRKLRKKISLF